MVSKSKALFFVISLGLGGLAYGQTVLARAARAAGIEWDQRDAHSAIYDAERTADLFCAIVNAWGPPRGQG